VVGPQHLEGKKDVFWDIKHGNVEELHVTACDVED
jgi:hypothetical protein